MNSVSVLIPSTEENTTSIRLRTDETWRKYAGELIIDYTEGISRARNRLASRATGEILVFLDDDTLLDSKWWPKIVAVKPRQLYMAEGISHPITRVMSITRETFDDLGGFDEKIRHNAEDYDFYLRAKKAGINIFIIPKAAVDHEKHPGENPFWGAMDSAYVIVKNRALDLSYFLVKNPLKILFRALWLIYYVFKGVE